MSSFYAQDHPLPDPLPSRERETPVRIQLKIRGIVQGVGFRPFVFRLAQEMGVAGSVWNTSEGVEIEAEGLSEILDDFIFRLQKEKPPHAVISSLELAHFEPQGSRRFEIHPSRETEKKGGVLPDLATCPECLQEIFDPNNRRYRYPFTNCTHCGPRFSILEALPYDRAHTTMKDFVMCELCRAEYENPSDRRFHAQPNACPQCGPQIELWDPHGKILASHHEALLEAAEAIRDGKIVAVKGLGGFHLMVDARNEEAVALLRKRKGREEKPFALMFPSLSAIRSVAECCELEEQLLLSAESPIILLKMSSMSPSPRPPSTSLRTGSPVQGEGGILVSGEVSPKNPNLGVMLPSTPLHHLLMRMRPWFD
jgi:hydrogenase maturation protein HypF